MSQADLEQADLSEASLIRVDLRQANLKGANLTEVNLSAANLSEANLSKSELNDAYLAEANLYGANLTQTNLLQTKAWLTNFSGCILTGVCIDNLQINRQTSFKKVICKYLYLKYYQQQRKPENPDQYLTSDEFNLILQDLIASVNIVLDADINWSFLLNTVEELQREYQDKIEIKAVEVLTNHRFMVRMTFPADSEIEAIKKYFLHKYNLISLSQNKLIGKKNSRVI